MVKSFLKRYRKSHFLSNQATASGFTLIELLVAMVVASLISVGLLFVVVQIVQTNLRESARSDTQRDLQSAIDYIARDVREAVYVYDASCLLDRPTATNSATYPNSSSCPGLRSYLPDSIIGASGASGFGATDANGNLINVPVLAFWRVDLLPDALNNVCQSKADAYSQSPPSTPIEIQNVPCLSGRMYTLVVYSLNKETTGRAVSRGRARIMRYALPQFTSGSVQAAGAAPTMTQGWADPRGQKTSFLAWPVDKSSIGATPISLQTGGRPTANNAPLTDFVDWNGLYDLSTNPVGRGRAPDRSSENLILTPQNGATAETDPPRGFYVYVKGAENGGSLNQEVLIRIQGDAAGRAGVPDTAATRPVVPISLETRVLTRGVTNKQL